MCEEREPEEAWYPRAKWTCIAKLRLASSPSSRMQCDLGRFRVGNRQPQRAEARPTGYAGGKTARTIHAVALFGTGQPPFSERWLEGPASEVAMCVSGRAALRRSPCPIDRSRQAESIRWSRRWPYQFAGTLLAEDIAIPGACRRIPAPAPTGRGRQGSPKRSSPRTEGVAR